MKIKSQSEAKANVKKKEEENYTSGHLIFSLVGCLVGL